MHEEHMAFETALWFPLAAGLAITMAARERNNVDDGNSFVDREIDKATRKMRRYLFENFEIV